ncbi:MAG: hypothetical protein HYZ38_22000 [Mycobacterium sp.]|nr:hypothetical protein [Mycobacterium sp.]
MIHKHHEWLADVNKSIVESYDREQETSREPGRTQETGHTVESRWDEVLAEWLPPQYEIGKRKYLLLEKDDGPETTKETDLVVFYPHYPAKLRKKNYVLASGVAAAFSVRRTVGRKDIEDAYKEALLLRRGMRIREGTLQAHLIPPVFFGLLGESHEWKAPASTPEDNIKAITGEFDRDLVGSPREGLDLICIADLGTWSRTVSILPAAFLKRQTAAVPKFSIFTNSYGTDSLVMSGMLHDYEQQNLSPLTSLIGALWDKLASNDPSLKPLANGLRITKTMDARGSFDMGSGPYKLAEIATPKIDSQYRNHTEPWSV